MRIFLLILLVGCANVEDNTTISDKAVIVSFLL
jgi:hypothetical protein